MIKGLRKVSNSPNMNNPFRGYSNAKKVLVGRDSYGNKIVLGEFSAFVSGHIYFGRVKQFRFPNGLSVATRGTIDIIKENNTVVLTALSPYGRTVVAKRTVRFIDWKTVFSEARKLHKESNLDMKKPEKGDMVKGLIDISGEF